MSYIPLTAIFNHCRIYLVSGSPYADGSSSGNGTLYFGPCSNLGQYLTQENGSGSLTTVAISEISLSLTLTSGSAYDVYEYNNAGTQTLEVVVWSNTSTPPTRSTDAAGRLCKNGSTGHLLVGIIYATTTNKTADWTGQRHVNNVYNKTQKAINASDSTVTWTTTSTSFQSANGSTTDGAGRFSFMSDGINAISPATFCIVRNSTAGVACFWAIGLNSTTVSTVNAATTVPTANAYQSFSCAYSGILATGYNYVQLLQSVAAFTGTFYGAGYSGMYAMLLC
jgi:hypothetical protein